jgi:uncharacterized protein YggE
MKKIALSIVVSVIVNAAYGSPLPDYPLAYAIGAAKTNIAPNTATVNYRVVVRDKDATKATQAIQSRSADTIALLLKEGVKKEDIVAFEVEKNVVQDSENQKRLEFLGYEVARPTRFTIQDFEKYQTIISTLMKMPDVVDIRTTFDRTDRKSIEATLVAQAVADAKTKTQVLLDGAGQRIVKLRALSEYGFYDLAGTFGLESRMSSGRAAGATAQPAETLFAPTTIEFHSSVSVIYEIEEKK